MKADINIEAFASVYDEYETLSRVNFIDRSRRATIREHVEKFLTEGDDILELNSGSGIDAVYFVQKGHAVLATDISESSGRIIEAKAAQLGLKNLRFAQSSFTELDKTTDERFNYIFSNFGGLNCTCDLKSVFDQFPKLLRPGGIVTLVVMPKYYPWEMFSALKGNKNAFRRFNETASAKVGLETIPIFYHSPGAIRSAFPKNFTHVATQNIGTFYPSAHFKSFGSYKRIIQRLVKIDNAVNRWWLMPKGVGDYFIITFQKTG